eukprot:gnl/MRDRNA2_/MRDRNA2_130787_c0_seq1.p1 gnl/MRDRNA2_/MRDRNA2_130787_c0~~gnl/MRDRNA2_/MRDRNA2_130787_c0_seq1.p1  ORF type:complete len:430 (+),score=105.10 gnl/MRDRNA2_/MRDRNA2_130787_c0_seq1:189-1292(+)
MTSGCVRDVSVYVQSLQARFYSLSRVDVEKEVGSLVRLQKSFEQRGVVTRVEMFKFLSQEELLDLVSLFQLKTEPADTVLCRQGSVEEHFFVLLEGKVLKSYPATGEPPQTLSCDGHSSNKEVVTFGEESLMKGDADRRCTVTTITDCRLLVVCRDDIEDRFGHLGELLEKRERMLNRIEVDAPKDVSRKEAPKEKTLAQMKTECVKERGELDKFKEATELEKSVLPQEVDVSKFRAKNLVQRGAVYTSAKLGPGYTSEEAAKYMKKVADQAAGVEGVYNRTDIDSALEKRQKARADYDNAPKLSPRKHSPRMRKTEGDMPEEDQQKIRGQRLAPVANGPAVQIDDLTDAVIYDANEKERKGTERKE